MVETMRTFCPSCDREVVAALVKRRETLPVLGKPTEYDAIIATCPVCGEAIGDSRVESGNLTRVYDAYRRAHVMMTSEEIAGLRRSNGMSLHEFAQSIGLSDETLARYERGALQDPEHDRAMRSALGGAGAMRERLGRAE